ncbi:Na+/H+ antiporter subunit E [Actinomarinicola tropica]|uniref:Na+/H+ antiporter subunit E n=1 Tax=Actinomarinicola tropica TaxID=2789776 RepID=A0A5Q2RQE5_9ACTN|nr:Na+/H+ antiporter subunit E [Actinomarinicola tropica]QGG96120.1 Na+/H+ antiporter subunit E [Actinomarinicola tropica]
MIRRLAVVGLMTFIWVGLWGDVSVANVLSGIVVSLVALAITPIDHPPIRGALRPLPALGYAGYYVRQLLVANAVVAWEVVTPHNRDNEGIIAVPYPPSVSPTVLTLIVNSIGLTPGTVVVDIAEDPCVLYVHVLHLDDRERSRDELLELERRAVRAFGSDAACEEMAGLLRRRHEEVA